LERVPNNSDGNCIFHSFGEAYHRIAGGMDMEGIEPHIAVRFMAVEQMQIYKPIYEASWDGTAPTKQRGEKLESFDEYLKMIATAGSLGCLLEIRALAMHLGSEVTIFSDDVPPLVINPEPSDLSMDKIYLWFDRENNHYDWMDGFSTSRR
jgi:hypothetical protein